MIRLSEDSSCESWLHLESALKSGDILVIDIGVTGALISKDVKKLRDFKNRPSAPVSAWGDLHHYWNNRHNDKHTNHSHDLPKHLFGKAFLRFLIDESKLQSHHIPHEAINNEGYLQVYGYHEDSDNFLHKVQSFILQKIDNYFIYVTSTNKKALPTVRGEHNLKMWCDENNIKFFALPENIRDTYIHRGSYPIIQAGVNSPELLLMRKGWIDILKYFKDQRFDIKDLTE